MDIETMKKMRNLSPKERAELQGDSARNMTDKERAEHEVRMGCPSQNSEEAKEWNKKGKEGLIWDCNK